jgi:hypothetical protein
MGVGLKRTQAATQLRWIERPNGTGSSLSLWALVATSNREMGTVYYLMKGIENDGWYASVRGYGMGKFSSCRAAKLAVRREVRRGR